MGRDNLLYMPNQTDIGARIRAARQARNLTKAELARRIKRTRSLVSQWENGRVKKLSAESLAMLSKELREPQDYFLYGRRPHAMTHRVDGVFEVPLIDWGVSGYGR